MFKIRHQLNFRLFFYFHALLSTQFICISCLSMKFNLEVKKNASEYDSILYQIDVNDNPRSTLKHCEKERCPLKQYKKSISPFLVCTKNNGIK